MARHGVDFETVKQAALKLLSQGVSPSVQKVRESLGTGSNSTIAEHLKIWREQHAAKKVHHLPASIPEELIATFETLWQTAMEHAEQQFSEVKESLNAQEDRLNQEKIATDKTVADLKLQLDQLQEKIEIKSEVNQTLQTKLAIAKERYEKQIVDISKLEQQYDLRLKHLLDEKHQAIEKVEQLQSEIQKLQQSIAEQSCKHQSILAKERELQEESEKRWVQIIDQARSESNNWRKKNDDTARKQNDKIESLQNKLMRLQDELIAIQSAVSHRDDMINSLNKQIEQLQNKYTTSLTESAVLKARLKTVACKKSNNKLAETV